MDNLLLVRFHFLQDLVMVCPFLKEEDYGLGEMAQREQCLLSKSDYLRPDPKCPCKQQSQWNASIIPVFRDF